MAFIALSILLGGMWLGYHHPGAYMAVLTLLGALAWFCERDYRAFDKSLRL